MKKTRSFIPFALMASLTLGLAPFTPEPHIWKQIMNLTHGRKMLAIDWLDILMHGAPWLVLIVLLLIELRKFLKKKDVG